MSEAEAEAHAVATRASGRRAAVGARLPLDAWLVVPALLLIAREAILFTPTRELAWQLFHDERVARRAAFLGWLLPRPSGAWDVDPVGLALGALASLLALVYLAAASLGARARTRAALLILGGLVVVGLPTAGCVGLGWAMRLPYGHDGGVVQLPLALDKVIAGASPYGADYSRSALGRQARNSEFWTPLGGNPITRHHWYLPGVHLVMLPPYLASRRWLGVFDPRLVTFFFYGLCAWLAARLAAGAAPAGAERSERALAAAAVVLVHPLVWWPQAFGVNDVMCAVPLLLAFLAAARGARLASAAWLGVACALKQLVWPFAPFLLVYLSGADSWPALLRGVQARRLAGATATCVAVACTLVLPIAWRDPAAFVADIFRYQVGLPGEDQYPLGGTPGLGFANFLIYSGAVRTLGDAFPFSRFYVLLVPLGLLLLHRLLKHPSVGSAMVAGSLALLASLYLSRIVNPNYVLLAALCLPLALLRERRLPLDLALVPLALLLLAQEAALRELLRTTWQVAATVGHVPGLPTWLEPGDGPRWRDPLSLAWAALAAGLACCYGVLAYAGAARPWRRVAQVLAALALVLLPSWLVVEAGRAARVVRAQDRFVSDTRAAAPLERVGGLPVAPPPSVEAVTRSFRKLGEKTYVTADADWPTRTVLGRLLDAVHLSDPRWATLPALLLVLAWVRRRPGFEAEALGALLLCPLGAVGLALGSGHALALGLLCLAAALLGAKRAPTLAGGVAGCATGLALAWFPECWLALPWLLARARAWRIPVMGALLAWLGLALALLPGAGAGRTHALLPTLELQLAANDAPLGLLGLLAYRGREELGPMIAGVLTWALPLLAIALTVACRRAARASGLAAWSTTATGAATLVLAAQWLDPRAEPHAVLLPLGLLLLAGGAAAEHKQSTDAGPDTAGAIPGLP
jgi:hypothetical protein